MSIGIYMGRLGLSAGNRDTAAIQAKLDHLMMSGDGDNHLFGIEMRRAAEIEDIRSSNHSKAIV
jgi:low affinity Fe/Cu permease